jgi:hypothetical protein
VLDQGAEAGDKPAEVGEVTSAAGTAALAEETDAKKEGVPKKGHGRNGAAKYANAPVIEGAVADLKSGDPCPECFAGEVYDAPPRPSSKWSATRR